MMDIVKVFQIDLSQTKNENDSGFKLICKKSTYFRVVLF